MKKIKIKFDSLQNFAVRYKLGKYNFKYTLGLDTDVDVDIIKVMYNNWAILINEKYLVINNDKYNLKLWNINDEDNIFYISEFTAYEAFKYLVIKEDKLYKDNNITEFEMNIGKLVYKESLNKFKSKNHFNTVKEIINHPILNIPAYTFLEDDSYVECRRCAIVLDYMLNDKSKVYENKCVAY